MMRCLLAVMLTVVPSAAFAFAAAPGQVIIGPKDVLRGHFTEVRVMQGFNKPMKSAGQFVVAPATGLIWAIQKPFPTTTVITPAGLVQQIENVPIMSLPATKIPFMLHLYEMLGGALAGNWTPLEQDFKVGLSGNAQHWQVTLEPKAPNASLPFSSIVVSGSRFLESVALLKGEGESDTFTFSDEVVASAPPSAAETATFSSVHP